MSTDTHSHIACAQCGALNRVPRQRLRDDPSCGQCHQPLLTGQPLELGDADFDRWARRTELPVVIDFWAPWCGPCRMMAPAFEQAASTLKGQAVLVKVNSDQNPQLSARFGIRSIPTLVRLQAGNETGRMSGALPVGQIVAFAAQKS